MTLPSFREYYLTVKNLEECISKNDGTIEGFLDLLEEKQLNIEDVMTSDIAQMTLPIVSLGRRKNPVSEVAPDDPEIEDFIVKNKSSFKKRYGEDWEKILYATAWKLYNQKKSK